MRRLEALAARGHVHRSQAQGVAPGAHTPGAARAPEIRRHRHGAGRRVRHAGRDARALRRGLPAALFVPDAGSSAARRDSVGRGDRRRRTPTSTAMPVAPARRGRMALQTAASAVQRVLRRRAGTTTPLYRRDDTRPGDRIDGPAIIAEANATTVVEPGWQAQSPSWTTWCCGASSPRRGPARDRHHGRPGDARGLQQPLHVDRRADGSAAAEHRLLGQHQGAARLLLRAVRCRGQPDRQCAAHAGAPGLDERVDQDRDARKRRPHGRRATPT